MLTLYWVAYSATFHSKDSKTISGFIELHRCSESVHFLDKTVMSKTIIVECNGHLPVSSSACFNVVFGALNRGSYMSAHVLLNLLNKLWKYTKCEACRTFYLLFATSLIN